MWLFTAVSAGVTASIVGLIVGLSQGVESKIVRAVGNTLNSTHTQSLDTASGPTLAVTVGEGFYWCHGGDGWVFPSSASQAYKQPPGEGPTQGGSTWDADPAAWGAVMASAVQVEFTASSGSEKAIVLTGVEAEVTRRRPALSGALVQIERACAAPTVHIGTIDLDTVPPTLQPAPTDQPVPVPRGLASGQRAAPLQFPYTVSASDPEVFVLTVTTAHCDCTWDLRLHWVDGSKVGTSVINDDGEPFETTASAGLPLFDWVGDSGSGWSLNQR